MATAWTKPASPDACWVKLTFGFEVHGTDADTAIFLPELDQEFGAFCVTDDGEVEIIDGPSALRT